MAKRMASDEQSAYLSLRAAINMANAQEETLSRRMEGIPGAKRYLHSGLGMLRKLVAGLDSTIPPEQYDHFERQIPTLKMIIGIKAQLPRNYDQECGRWLSFEQLDVVTTAIRECCLVCNITDPQDQKQCMYRKLLDVLPSDKPDEDARGCGYFTMWQKWT